MKRIILGTLTLMAIGLSTPAAAVELARQGQARSAIYVAPEVMVADVAVGSRTPAAEVQAEEGRRRLRESVKDLSLYLGKMSETPIPVVEGQPETKDVRVPILIGNYADAKFGPPRKATAFKQGWRLVVSKGGIGLMGESDEAASYAIYELLDRLGCRWFMPGELGESIPRRRSLAIANIDVSGVPSTHYRDIPYADAAFKRRNRLGGFALQINRDLEDYISAEQRKEHPEWVGVVDGKPHYLRLKWSVPGVAEAVADRIVELLDARYTPSIPLTPHDGTNFDESADLAWDAGDWDPSLNRMSITDRYIRFCNRVAERVTKKYPDVLFTVTAYVHYSRPPVREKVHPNIVPVIAPITYCRAHSMTDTHICPSRPQVRPLIEGWSKVSRHFSYTPVLFHRVEMTVPYPMIHQMKTELPVLFANKMAFWQPQTHGNFESVLPGLWLTVRKTWDRNLDSDRVLSEFYTRFYGAAAKPMRRYWTIFDDAWTNTPEHAGSSYGYLRRYTPSVMTEARRAINEAMKAAGTPLELRRVEMQERALGQFERLMQLHRDISEGRLAGLDLRVAEWRDTQGKLADQYADNFAFTKTSKAPGNGADTYFRIYLMNSFVEGGRITREYTLASEPLREWSYKIEKADETKWQQTNVAVDTWYKLGLHDYYGTMLYRREVNIPAVPAGKKIYLWVSRGEGEFKVIVNGVPVPYENAKGENAKGEKREQTESIFSAPLSFDITAAAKPAAANTITIAATRTQASELGTGGLLGPVYLYHEK